jgi:hypothetical protein
MRKLILTTAILLTGLSAGCARGMHSTGTGALMAPANPTVPPSLPPDPRVTASALRADVGSLQGLSLTPDPEDARVDQMIK